MSKDKKVKKNKEVKEEKKVKKVKKDKEEKKAKKVVKEEKKVKKDKEEKKAKKDKEEKKAKKVKEEKKEKKVKKEEKKKDKRSAIDRYETYKVDKDTVKAEKAALESGDFLTIDDGETVVRILPAKNSSDKPWVHSRRHYLETADGKRDSILCTGDEECMGCAAIRYITQKLKGAEARDLAKRIAPKQRTYFAVVDRRTNEVKIMAAGKELTGKIITPLTSVNPFSPTKGADFTVMKEKKGKGGWPTYVNSFYGQAGVPLLPSGIKKSDSDKVKAKKREIQKKAIENMLNSIPDITPFATSDREESMENFKLALSENGVDLDEFILFAKGDLDESELADISDDELDDELDDEEDDLENDEDDDDDEDEDEDEDDDDDEEDEDDEDEDDDDDDDDDEFDDDDDED